MSIYAAISAYIVVSTSLSKEALKGGETMRVKVRSV